MKSLKKSKQRQNEVKATVNLKRKKKKVNRYENLPCVIHKISNTNFHAHTIAQ